MPEPIELVSVRFENIRNFSNATLPLNNDKFVLVGRNNAGKTSALVLLDWLLNDLDTDKLKYSESAKWDCQDVLLPARETKKKARRITLNICVHDGRMRSSLNTDKSNCTQLRLNVGATRDFRLCAKLGEPSRNEGWKSDSKAVDLLKSLQETYHCVYIPSFRDAGSVRFGKGLGRAFSDALGEKATKTGKKGRQFNEYTQVSEMGVKLKEMAETLTGSVVDRLKKGAPFGLLENVNVSLDTSPEAMINWLTEQLDVTLTTGAHDDGSVDSRSVGSGLQSILDVALHTTVDQDPASRSLLMIEEPEAFLHPSAQRQIARQLVSAKHARSSFILTTHSPFVVEEAGFGPLCLVRDQEFYPHDEQEERELAIKTQLLRNAGSEMVFAQSVLLVEGPGDLQFYEALRHRLAAHDPSGAMDRLFVVSVGGAAQFCPWVRLARAFRRGDGSQPFSFLVVMDADRAEDMREVATAAKTSAQKSVLKEIENVAKAYGKAKKSEASEADVESWHSETHLANTAFASRDYPLAFHIGDLEYASLRSVDVETLESFRDDFSMGCEDPNGFMRKLGTKGVTGRAENEPKKGPWIRGLIGANLPRSAVTVETRDILDRWISPVLDEHKRTSLLSNDW